MDILYLLIPLSAVLVLAIIGVFGWALYRGQFEDLEHEGDRILHNDVTGADTSGTVPPPLPLPSTEDGSAKPGTTRAGVSPASDAQRDAPSRP